MLPRMNNHLFRVNNYARDSETSNWFQRGYTDYFETSPSVYKQAVVMPNPYLRERYEKEQLLKEAKIRAWDKLSWYKRLTTPRPPGFLRRTQEEWEKDAKAYSLI